MTFFCAAASNAQPELLDEIDGRCGTNEDEDFEMVSFEEIRGNGEGKGKVIEIRGECFEYFSTIRLSTLDHQAHP